MSLSSSHVSFCKFLLENNDSREDVDSNSDKTATGNLVRESKVSGMAFQNLSTQVFYIFQSWPG
jgi:hypothetical protein